MGRDKGSTQQQSRFPDEKKKEILQRVSHTGRTCEGKRRENLGGRQRKRVPL